MRPVLEIGAAVIGVVAFLYLVFVVVAWGVVPWIIDKFRGWHAKLS
jgi:hypothetical protein